MPQEFVGEEMGFLHCVHLSCDRGSVDCGTDAWKTAWNDVERVLQERFGEGVVFCTARRCSGRELENAGNRQRDLTGWLLVGNCQCVLRKTGKWCLLLDFKVRKSGGPDARLHSGGVEG